MCPANISPGRQRDVLYFDTQINIVRYGYDAATCAIGGGGASGPLTCSIPRDAGVSTLCMLGDDTLSIRAGRCDPRAGESAVRVIATIR